MLAHSRVGTAGSCRCSSYIISISFLHSDREEGGSCRLPSHHLRGISPLLFSWKRFSSWSCSSSPFINLVHSFSLPTISSCLSLHFPFFPPPLVLASSQFATVHPSVRRHQPVIVQTSNQIHLSNCFLWWCSCYIDKIHLERGRASSTLTGEWL